MMFGPSWYHTLIALTPMVFRLNGTSWEDITIIYLVGIFAGVIEIDATLKRSTYYQEGREEPKKN